MNKPSKCKNCQWYGKPYWSIINPCDNCSNEDNIEIITIGDVKSIKECLTEEEIKKAMTNKSIFEITLEEKDKEIDRLNNIISKINKIIEDYYLYDYKDESIARLKALENINHEIYKLKELKEGKQ